MSRISISRDLPVTHEVVWDALADLGSHAEWMRDAERIEFTSDQRTGVGTTMQVQTRVGPLQTVDVLEVVGWHEGSSIDVIHRGLVKGTGTIAVEPNEIGARVTWVEDLRFPWWLGGPVASWLARPVLAAIWKGNLARLEESLSSP